MIYLPFRALRTAIGTALAILPACLPGNFGAKCRKYLQSEYSDWENMATATMALPGIAREIINRAWEKEEEPCRQKINQLNLELKDKIKPSNFRNLINQDAFNLLLESQQLQEIQDEQVYSPKAMAVQHVALAKKYTELANFLATEYPEEEQKLHNIAKTHQNLAAANIELKQFRNADFGKRLPKYLDMGLAYIAAIPAACMNTLIFPALKSLGKILTVAATVVFSPFILGFSLCVIGFGNGTWEGEFPNLTKASKIWRGDSTWKREFPNLTKEGFEVNFAAFKEGLMANFTACKDWFKSLSGKINVLWQNFSARFDTSTAAYITATAATAANPPVATPAAREVGTPAKATLTPRAEKSATAQDRNGHKERMGKVLKELKSHHSAEGEGTTQANSALTYLKKQKQAAQEGQPAPSAAEEQPTPGANDKPKPVP